MNKKSIKTKRDKEPVWLGLSALFIGYLVYIIVFSILTGRFDASLGLKGEGLLFTLIFYIPVRIVLREIYHLRKKRKQS